MNFNHLHYFLMVAEELNITRAAERLYISQQSLSTHISNLEKEVNVKLFTRSPKLALTYAGSLLVDTSQKILSLHSQFLNQVGDFNQHYTGVLRLGISHTCGLTLLPKLFPKFRAEFPLVEFSLFEGNSTQLEDELIHRRSDFLICFQPVWVENAQITQLSPVRLVLVVPKTFTQAVFGDRAETIGQEGAEGGIDISLFQNHPFVFLKRGDRTRGLVNDYLHQRSFTPSVAIETENTVTALALAQAQAGIFLCPDLFLESKLSPLNMSQDLDFFPLAEESATGSLVLVNLNDLEISPFFHRFTQLVQELFAEQT